MSDHTTEDAAPPSHAVELSRVGMGLDRDPWRQHLLQGKEQGGKLKQQGAGRKRVLWQELHWGGYSG